MNVMMDAGAKAARAKLEQQPATQQTADNNSANA